MAAKIAILDGYSLLYRAYHALSTPMTAPDGTPTNAIHGFMMMLIRILQSEKPDGIVVAFDVHAPTRRAQKYAEYKANRSPMPDDLRAQVPVLRELIGLMHIPILELAGYEADDILGTVSLHCEESGAQALLVTGDRDSFQLAGACTTILYTRKGITDTEKVTPDWIREHYGVTPVQMIDVKSLMGDTSDNIPGIPGIGEKTALKLVSEYGGLEAVLASAPEQKGKLRQRLEEHADLARLSRELAEIDRHVPIELDPDQWKVGALGDALPRLRLLGMNSVSARLSELVRDSAHEQPEAPAVLSEDLPPVERVDTPQALRARCEALAKGAKWMSFYVGASLTLATDAARLELPMGGDLLNPGVTEEEAVGALSPLLGSDCPKALYNLKDMPFDPTRCRGRIHDVMLSAYVINPQQPSFEAEALCQAAQIPGFAAHPATALKALADVQQARMREDGSGKIYDEIELPLAHVLRDMEREGFLVDAGALEKLGVTFRAEIARLTDEIAEMAGERVNLNSPKQLAELLFDRMGLPSGRKGGKGRSTNAEVLEHLAQDYPICGKILEYRKYQKLESTYIQSLTGMRDQNGRIHTRFDQVATATGRISSSEPNLQNIPVRTELGRQIRSAFVAPEGCILVDADYSQIELRVLAHISQDTTMLEAFREGQDIHARTAAEVYGVPLDQVTHEMRTSCKAVNFGIVYGISDYTLAANLSISRKEARAFIDRYFERYPGVKRYLDRAVEDGRRNGYVTTLMNRRRYLPELASSNFNVRSFGERCAMNSPIQGTAADIIKLAMIRVDERLKGEGLRSKLLLQVHDELIIQSPLEEADRAAALLRDCMENVVRLDVPLVVEITTGGDWRACK